MLPSSLQNWRFCRSLVFDRVSVDFKMVGAHGHYELTVHYEVHPANVRTRHTSESCVVVRDEALELRLKKLTDPVLQMFPPGYETKHLTRLRR